MVSYCITRVFAVLGMILVFTLPAVAEPKIDFNGDGRADIFWRNFFSGNIVSWLLNGGQILQDPSYGSRSVCDGWTPLGSGDFNGDGRTDVLWYNLKTTILSAWLIGGTQVLQAPSYRTVDPTSGWSPIAFKDFNGDGRTDILWYNGKTGALSAWLLNGGQILQYTSYPTVVPGSGWVPIGFEDLNGDGRSDILWYRVQTGDLTVWFLNGGQPLQSASYLRVAPGSGWVPIGLKDFNGDGRADILWYNGISGNVAAWLLNGSQILQSPIYGNVPPNSGWAPIGIEDFNGDGRGDILWRRADTGALSAWLINGSQVLDNTAYGALAPNSGWAPARLDDFNGDNRTDVLWYNAGTGGLLAWFISGAQVIQTVSYGAVPPTSGWQM